MEEEEGKKNGRGGKGGGGKSGQRKEMERKRTMDMQWEEEKRRQESFHMQDSLLNIKSIHSGTHCYKRLDVLK